MESSASAAASAAAARKCRSSSAQSPGGTRATREKWLELKLVGVGILLRSGWVQLVGVEVGVEVRVDVEVDVEVG